MDAYRLWIICFLLWFGHVTYAQSVLDKKVSIDAKEETIEKVLDEIARTGSFTFAYNAEVLPVDSIVTVLYINKSVRYILEDIFIDISYKEHGSHLVLTQKKLDKAPSPKLSKYDYVISGYIINKKTGECIANTTIYDLDKLESTLSDLTGYYELTVSTKKEFLGIGYSRLDFADTIIIVKPADIDQLDVKLLPDEPYPIREYDHEVISPIPIKTLPKDTLKPIQEVAIVKFMVPEDQIAENNNMEDQMNGDWQISLIPSVGKNKKLSGAFTNNLSFNVISGYNGGVDGIEVGGGININRKHVDGIQISGFSNITGGQTNGLQLTGFLNLNRGKVKGGQMSGFANIVGDTLVGIQATGFMNLVRGKMTGIQLAGFINLTTRNMHGSQVSGFANIARKEVYGAQATGFINVTGDVKLAQIAGFANVGRKIGGVQVAGFTNISSKRVGGVQLAGFMNVAQEVRAPQFAGFANIALGEVHGAQVSGILNVAKTVKGSQIGFINVSDSVSGAAIGFLSIVRKGYRRFVITRDDVNDIGLTLITGTKQFYNVFEGGYSQSSNNGLRDDVWTFGYGLGRQMKMFKKALLNAELSSNHVEESVTGIRDFNLLNRFKLLIGYRFANKVTLFAGTTFNVHISQLRNPDTGEFISTIANNPFHEWSTIHSRTQLWFGYQFGLRF